MALDDDTIQCQACGWLWLPEDLKCPNCGTEQKKE